MPRTDAHLIIRIDAEQALSWWLRDAKGQVTTGGALTDLTAIDSSTPVTVIVPGSEVLLTEADFPDLPPARLLKALPFALEEQLASNIEALHFATSSRNRGEPLPVAVVAQSVLDAWLAKLAEARIMADTMVPDCLCMPWVADSWSVVLVGNSALVRTGRCGGFTIEPAQLPDLLKTALADADDARPARLRVMGDGTSEFEVQRLADLGVEIETVELTRPFIESAAAVLTTEAPALNVLQGAYQPVHRTAKLQRQWRWVKLLVVAWLAVFVLGHVGQLVYLKVVDGRLTKQVNAIYQRDFPQAAAVVEPRAMIGRELNQLTAAATGSDFLRIFAIAGDAIHEAKGVKLLSLTFQNKRLTLNLRAPNFTTLNQLEEKMRARNLIVKQASASTKAKVVEAQLSITAEK